MNEYSYKDVKCTIFGPNGNLDIECQSPVEEKKLMEVSEYIKILAKKIGKIIEKDKKKYFFDGDIKIKIK